MEAISFKALRISSEETEAGSGDGAESGADTETSL
jgi:hypothetical protein